MLFSRSVFAALFSAPLLAFAQSNPFKNPADFSASAGTAVKLEWTATTPGTISLILRSGASNDLEAGTIIVSNLKNSGSYVWTPSPSLLRGSDYTIEIVDDSDPSQTNYTPYFVLDTPTTVATTTSQESLGAPTTTLSLSTASPTSTASTTSASSASTTSSSAASSSSASSTTMTTSLASSQIANSAAAVNTPTSSPSGAAPRATAMAGLLGIVALGAFAL